MPETKYFAGISTAQQNQTNISEGNLGRFDFASIGPKTRMGRITGKVTQKLIPPVYAFARVFRPILPLAGLIHIARDAQVREILSRPLDFPTPFGPEMKELGAGFTFLLGQDGPEHGRLSQILREIIHPSDIERICGLSRQFTQGLLENGGGRFDVIGSVIQRVPTEICFRYFGLSCDDSEGFSDWVLAISAMLFGDPYGDPSVRALAMNAAVRVRAVISDSLRRTQAAFEVGQSESVLQDNLLGRLVIMQQSGRVSDGEIKAIVLGMIAGFIPTNTLASAKILEELLKRPVAWELARSAAVANDHETMLKVILEASRLNPALAPGQWRYCPVDTTVDVDGKPHLIKAGSTLLVSNLSAMRDKRAFEQPGKFRIDRTGPDGQWLKPDLVYGLGPHRCLGDHLANAQITALFMVLFKQPNLKPAKGKAGKLQAIGPFPRNLVMTFDTPAAKQSMFLIIAPALVGATKYVVDKEIAALGNPATEAMRQRLDATSLVHFTSVATIPADDALRIVMELTVDGGIDEALAEIAKVCDDLLRPIFAHAGLGAGEALATFLRRHVVELHGKMWGATGLNYNGLPEFPVKGVEKQARFGAFVERAIADFMSSEANRGSHPMRLLTHVRRILRQDSILAQKATPAQDALMDEAKREGFDGYSMIPGDKPLCLAHYVPPSYGQSFSTFLASRESWIVTAPMAVLTVLFGFALVRMIPGQADATIAEIGLRLAGVAVGGLLLTAVAAAALSYAFFAAIRRDEKKAWVDDSSAPLGHVEALTAHEDAPGYAQNHIMALGEMKPGLLRSFAHAFSLWAIKIVILFAYRPGFVINMGTIHFARWWRVPGTNKVAFYSNFDGNWESYLEDFITRARWGQTAVWSNWKGFPETRYLAFKGAEDGDRFKRWVRVRQQVVPFWYSRFPTISTDRIRTNALIHSGVAQAKTASEAQEWMRCFGSMPKVANLIETDEVQALVFGGMKRLKVSTCLILRLPAGEALGEWLAWIRGETQMAGRYEAGWLDALMQAGIILPVTAADGAIAGYCLSQSLALTFGDRPLVGEGGLSNPALGIDTDQPLSRTDSARMTRRAVFLACSAAGIDRFDPDITARFPASFRMGMAARGRQMGDHGSQSSDHWRWRDGKDAAEAALFVYAENAEDLTYASQVHASLIENFGGAILSQVDCAPANPAAASDREDIEHFGYRDGISQPVIKGSARALRGVPERDLIEPGEFILGYASGQGYFPPSPVIPATKDIRGHLPTLEDGVLSRYPDFGSAQFADAPRDLGRNGSYVVIRELAQDVDGFENFVTQKAAELRGACPASSGQSDYKDIYKVIGQHPDRDWVKAKLMGRWPNGRPLVGNPLNIPLADATDARALAAEQENDFAFGRDDPQGLACPFGAHIRRTNPRDSKQPGDKAEQWITNRHRLMRRGRPYVRKAEDGGQAEKGLLFVSLCTDLERQFEFVQQVWAASPSFHGLTQEPDPIIGGDIPDPDSKDSAQLPRCFTIPTAAGPIKLMGMQSFVTVKAGGYFFMPSRSALSYLTDVALSRVPESDKK